MNSNTQIFQNESQTVCEVAGVEKQVVSPVIQRVVNKRIQKEKAVKILQVRSLETVDVGGIFTTIDEKILTDFRNKPDFDMVAFVSVGSNNAEAAMKEKYCYCKMLLKPGGMLLLVLLEQKELCWRDFLPALLQKKAQEEHLNRLAKSGYVAVKKKIVPGLGVLVFGKRPASNLRY